MTSRSGYLAGSSKQPSLETTWDALVKSKYWKMWKQYYHNTMPRPKINARKCEKKKSISRREWDEFFSFVSLNPKYRSGEMQFIDYTKERLMDELALERIKRIEYQEILEAYNMLPDHSKK